MEFTEVISRYGFWQFTFAVLSGVVATIIIELCRKITLIITTKKRIKHLNIDCKIEIADGKVNYPCKLYIDLRNWTNTTILIKIEGFKLGKDIRPDPKATRDSTSRLIETKFIENTPQGEGSELNVDAIIRHGKNKMVWVPLDPEQPLNELKEALRQGAIGRLYAEILWFDKNPYYTRFRPIIRR
ncbi:MAG: hypothetical protein Q8O30_02620 [Candidatus Omnitrophota bacterium]|nr:hypothetical protein [Candidatus Omnitrophota bacterium]